MGNDKTKKLGKLYINTFNARNNGKPNSTIFLIRSNMTPTDKEITVNADIAKHIGGKIWPISHLSIKGIKYQGEIILFKNLCISIDWLGNLKKTYKNMKFLIIIWIIKLKTFLYQLKFSKNILIFFNQNKLTGSLFLFYVQIYF